MDTESTSARPATDLHVYVLPPIDEWFGWKNLGKVQADSIFPDKGAMAFMQRDARKEWRAEVDRLLYQGRKFAEANLGYGGDIHRGPFLSLLPGLGKTIPLVAWISADRDLTFVAASVPLPHLDALRSEVDALRAGPAPQKDDDIFSSAFVDLED